MKNIFFLILFLFLACSTDHVPSQTVSAKSYSHRVSLDVAATIVKDFLNERPLYELATTYGMGGTFPASLFDLSDDDKSVMLWFCLDEENKRFFLTLEQTAVGNNPESLPAFATSSKLYMPSSIFHYPSSESTDVSTVRQCLIAYSSKEKGARYIDTIDSTKVNGLIKNFNKWQAQNGEYCKYAFSCFKEDTEKSIKQLVEAAGNGGFIRYYFSFEKQDELGRDIINKIRITLVPVSANGRNYRVSEENAVILQRSIPPALQ